MSYKPEVLTPKERRDLEYRQCFEIQEMIRAMRPLKQLRQLTFKSEYLQTPVLDNER